MLSVRNTSPPDFGDAGSWMLSEVWFTISSASSTEYDNYIHECKFKFGNILLEFKLRQFAIFFMMCVWH